ncbi:MAG: hypothetical protein ABG776_19290 [Cyanobacteria bacterium J06555_13]
MKNTFSRCLWLLTTTTLALSHPGLSQPVFAEQNEIIPVSTLLTASPATTTDLIAREQYLYVSSPQDIDIQFQGDQPYPILLQLDRALVNDDGTVLIPKGADIMAQLRLNNGTTQIVAEKILIEGMGVAIQASSQPIPVQSQETRSEADKITNFVTYAAPISDGASGLLFEDPQVGGFVSSAMPYLLAALFIDADIEHTIHFPANQSILLKLNTPVALPADIARAVHGDSFFSTHLTNDLHNPQIDFL